MVQLRLKLLRAASLRREDFVLGASNQAAAAALDRWPDGLGRVLALVGPEGSGKTHLLADWVARRGAVRLSGEAASRVHLPALEGRPVAIDEADEIDDETLFHLMNQAEAPGGALLLASRRRPSAWRVALPDLISRLNAARVVELGAPDDEVLKGLLRRFFDQSSITPAAELVDYLAARIERSACEAREVVARLDAAPGPVTRASARAVLGPRLTASEGGF